MTPPTLSVGRAPDAINHMSMIDSRHPKMVDVLQENSAKYSSHKGIVRTNNSRGNICGDKTDIADLDIEIEYIEHDDDDDDNNDGKDGNHVNKRNNYMYNFDDNYDCIDDNYGHSYDERNIIGFPEETRVATGQTEVSGALKFPRSPRKCRGQNLQHPKKLDEYDGTEHNKDTATRARRLSGDGVSRFEPSTTPSQLGKASDMSCTPVLPPCRICGAKASGIHYGVNSCEACKRFFRRALKRPVLFSCSGDQNCDVKSYKRRDCRRCRYKRCLSQGMSREAIKTGRYSLSQRTRNIIEVKQLVRGPNILTEESDLSMIISNLLELHDSYIRSLTYTQEDMIYKRQIEYYNLFLLHHKLEECGRLRMVSNTSNPRPNPTLSLIDTTSMGVPTELGNRLQQQQQQQQLRQQSHDSLGSESVIEELAQAPSPLLLNSVLSTDSGFHDDEFLALDAKEKTPKELMTASLSMEGASNLVLDLSRKGEAETSSEGTLQGCSNGKQETASLVGRHGSPLTDSASRNTEQNLMQLKNEHILETRLKPTHQEPTLDDSMGFRVTKILSQSNENYSTKGQGHILKQNKRKFNFDSISDDDWTNTRNVRRRQNVKLETQGSDRVSSGQTHTPEKMLDLLLLNPESRASAIQRAEQWVLGYVRFAKTIPGFTSLPPIDQATLLRHAWDEVWILGAYRGYCSLLGVVMMPSGKCFHVEEMAREWGGDHARLTFDLADILKGHNLASELVTLLKVICIVSPDRCQLANKAKVEELHCLAVQCLRHHVAVHHGSNKGLLPRLVSVLTSLRELSESTQRNLRGVRFNPRRLVETFQMT